MKSKINSIDILLANNLRKIKRKLGVRSKELANALEVSIQQIQKYEKGQNRISSGNLFYLAQTLKVPLGYFFSLDEEKEPELWINEQQVLTIKGGSLNIKINGMQLNNIKGGLQAN